MHIMGSICGCTCVHVKTRSQPWCLFFSGHVPCFLKQGLSLGLDSHYQTRLAQQLRDLSVFTPHACLFIRMGAGLQLKPSCLCSQGFVTEHLASCFPNDWLQVAVILHDAVFPGLGGSTYLVFLLSVRNQLVYGLLVL